MNLQRLAVDSHTPGLSFASRVAGSLLFAGIGLGAGILVARFSDSGLFLIAAIVGGLTGITCIGYSMMRATGREVLPVASSGTANAALGGRMFGAALCLTFAYHLAFNSLPNVVRINSAGAITALYILGAAVTLLTVGGHGKLASLNAPLLALHRDLEPRGAVDGLGRNRLPLYRPPIDANCFRRSHC